MSSHRDNSKQRRNENLLKNLPTEVLLKARSTLVSLGSVLKPKQEQQQQRPKTQKDSKDKKKHDRLKSSRSEPEFGEARKNKHRSRIDDPGPRSTNGSRPRPLSVGVTRRYDKELEDFHCGSFPNDTSPLHQRKFDSVEEICVQSRLTIPVAERLNQDVQMLEVSERPRKKLSFREPEIVGSGSATLGRSHKHMGVNSLTRRPNRVSLRSDLHYSSLEGLDSDLESQAMRIVRTVGQAFEICHDRQNKIDMQTLAELQKNKMRNRMKQQSMPSTSSAASKPIPAGRSSEASTSKEGASDCGASDTAGASTSKKFDEIVVVKEDPAETFRAERLPPPPRKEGKQTPQRTTPVQGTSLLDLPDPAAKVEVTAVSTEMVTPLSAQHELQLLRQRLEQEAQQTQAAVAQLLLLRDQLAAEQSARCEAQARTHQLLVHNKELLEHIAALVGHLQERERGSSRPISAQQLTLLPQKVGVNAGEKSDNPPTSNGNRNQITTEALVHTNQQTTKASQGVENNNMKFSPCSVSPGSESANGPAPSFGSMSNEQIQEYLISKFQDMGGFLKEEKSDSVNNIQQSYQNNNAFPDIPPLANHSSDNDLANWLLDQKFNRDKSCSVEQLKDLAQAMSVGQSDNSACSTSQSSTSKDSTPDASSSDDGVVPFIMPLSNNAAFEATDNNGRVRIIVPVSPCDSASDVVQVNSEPQASSEATKAGPAPNRLLAPAAPITRTTSEKVSNRSELMTALRAQWTRHTTK